MTQPPNHDSVKPLALSLGHQLVQDISKSVLDVLSQTFAIQARAGHYELGEGTVKLSGDVSGLVGIVQNRLEGTLTACFEMDTVRKLIPRLLGDNIEVTEAVVVDAVAELTNMIFGSLKSELNKRGHHIRFGLPSVVTGPGHFISHLHQGEYLLVPFDIEGSRFQIHLAIHCIFAE